MEEIFVRVPNRCIRTDIESEYHVSRKFFVVYIFIGWYRNLNNESWFTVEKVCDFYGVKDSDTKSKILKEVVSVLKYMANMRMIEVLTDLDKVKLQYGIEIKIIPERFDPVSGYTKVTLKDMRYVKDVPCNVNRESLLIVMLHMLSFIYYRNGKGTDSRETGFYNSVENIVKDTGLAKNTIYKCIDALTTNANGNEPMFAKGTPRVSHGFKKLPSVYVVREGRYAARLAKLLKKIEDSDEPEKVTFDENFTYTEDGLDGLFK